MSRKHHRNTPATAPVAPPPTPPARARRRLILAAGATAVAAAGGGVLLWSGHADDDEAAARPELASTQAPSIGPATARVRIVEFIDPACETCAVFYPIVKQLLTEHPDRLRLVMRHVPLHKGADYVVALLEASRAQDRYWQTLEALLKAQDRWVLRHVVQPRLALEVIAPLGLNLEQLGIEMTSPAVQQRMAQDRADAERLGVKQTPEYFVNGRQMESFGRQQLLDLVNRALRKAYR